MDEATPADHETSARIDEAIGLKMISLRVEMRLIAELRGASRLHGEASLSNDVLGAEGRG